MQSKSFYLYVLSGALLILTFLITPANALDGTDITPGTACSTEDAVMMTANPSGTSGYILTCESGLWVDNSGGSSSSLWTDSGSGFIEYSSTLGGIRVESISGLPVPLSGGISDIPGGLNTQIQYNNSGLFAGDANFVWDKTLQTMTVVGDIDYTGGINDISDRRLKDNIMPLTRSLEHIIALQGVSFTMKDDETKVVELGLIAQDVELHFPTIVKTNTKGIKSLNYIGLIAPLIEAMKEHQNIISAQQQKLDEFRAHNIALEIRVKVLEEQ